MLTMTTVLTGELQRLRREMELAAERAERQKESLQQKLATMEKDYQAALQQARHAHEEDITRLTDSKAS